MNYDNEKLNEAITILWNDVKGELIPEHEKLTKFGYAINAWTENQNDTGFDLIELPFTYRDYVIDLGINFGVYVEKYIAVHKDDTDGECMTASTIGKLKMHVDNHLD